MKSTPRPRAVHILLALLLPALSGIGHAAADPVPIGRTPSQLVTAAKASPNPLVGTWEIERKIEDKDAQWVETTVLQFLADGTYKSSVRNSLFPDQAKQELVSGRYALANEDSKGFSLALRPLVGDPEGGKDPWSAPVRVDWQGADSLRGPDGSVLKRSK